MKRIVLAFIITLLVAPVIAQPPARQRQAKQQAEQQQQQQAVGVSERAKLEYPVAPSMPEDVSWRRDLYRAIDLSLDKNAVLYYPQEPEGDKMNLFTFLFKLVMRQQVTAYKHTFSGKENFTSANAVTREDILSRAGIPFQKNGDKIRVLDIDIPSDAVKLYYVKESTYFDQHTAQFRRQITALCPVLGQSDEFTSSGSRQVPMFWLKYEDIAPYLSKLELMASNYNNAATITADDYFTTNQYEGKIYMTSNLQGNKLPTDTTLAAVQKHIEGELTTLESHVWGTDSVAAKRMQARADSLAAANEATEEKAGKSSRKSKDSASDESTSSRSQLKRQKSGESTSSKSSKSSSPRISVRRQRH